VRLGCEEAGRASVLASPDFLRLPKLFGLAGTLALPPIWALGLCVSRQTKLDKA